ncbi:hypothetical protein Ancab_019231 [Ancistrocladus abbreviatus]
MVQHLVTILFTPIKSSNGQSKKLNLQARLVKENGPPYASGLKLSKLLMVLLWPYMEEVLEMNFRRARRVALELVENDNDLLLSPQFLVSLSVFAISSDRILIDSGTSLQDIVDHLTPWAILNFGANVLGRILQLFDKYANLLIKVLPSPSEDDNLAELREDLPFISETNSQQLALLGVAYTIANELLSTVVSRIWTSQNEIRELRSGLTKSIVPTAGNAMDYKYWKWHL